MGRFDKVPATVWILGFASLLTDVSTEMIHAVLPNYMAVVLKITFTQIGLIEGGAEAVASCLKIFSGSFSDYIGKRKILLVAGYGISAFFKPLYLIANSAGIVLAARLADRVGKGIRGAPRDALVADVTEPENRGRAYGLRQTLDTAGAIIGPLLGLLVMQLSASNYKLAFAWALPPAFLVVLLLIFGIKEPQNKCKVGKPIGWHSLKDLDTNFWWVVAVVLLFSLGNSSDAFILLKAYQVGIPAALCPLIFVLLNLTYGLTAYPAGIYSDKIGQGKILALSYLIYAVTYVGFALSKNPIEMFALSCLYGFYLGLSQGVLSALVSRLVPDNLRGTAFGLVNLVSGVALLPASFIAGYLFEHYSARAGLLAGALFAFAAFLLLLARPALWRKALIN
jgi:MFS family permease